MIMVVSPTKEGVTTQTKYPYAQPLVAFSSKFRGTVASNEWLLNATSGGEDALGRVF